MAESQPLLWRGLSKCYHGSVEAIPGVPAGQAEAGLDHPEARYNLLILLGFEGTSGVHQAPIKLQLPDRPVEHFPLPVLKASKVFRLEPPLVLGIARERSGSVARG